MKHTTQLSLRALRFETRINLHIIWKVLLPKSLRAGVVSGYRSVAVSIHIYRPRHDVNTLVAIVTRWRIAQLGTSQP